MEQVILAERGETSYRLIVPENCGKKTKYAAELFQKYFRECTGAELPFGRDGGAEKAVSVGETKRLAEFLGGEPREKMLDALNIRIAPDAVYLYGDDEDGTVNAVVEFLEKYLSVRFLLRTRHFVRKRNGWFFLSEAIGAFPILRPGCWDITGR